MISLFKRAQLGALLQPKLGSDQKAHLTNKNTNEKNLTRFTRSSYWRSRTTKPSHFMLSRLPVRTFGLHTLHKQMNKRWLVQQIWLFSSYEAHFHRLHTLVKVISAYRLSTVARAFPAIMTVLQNRQIQNWQLLGSNATVSHLASSRGDLLQIPTISKLLNSSHFKLELTVTVIQCVLS